MEVIKTNQLVDIVFNEQLLLLIVKKWYYNEMD